VKNCALLAFTWTALLWCASAEAQQSQPPESNSFTLWPKWAPFLDVGGKIGTQRDIGEGDLFIPLWQDNRSMVFGDFRFRADNQNSDEGNFGLGYRRMLDGGWNIGGYGYYDHRHSSTGNLFDQLTFGAELLGRDIDLRANYYSPIGQTQQLISTTSMGPNTAQVVNTTVQITVPGILATYEYALRGFDAEAGVRIPITEAESPFALRFYAGGFRFDEPTGTVPVVAGPRLRLEFTDYDLPIWGGSRLTAEAEWQTDAVRGSQFFGGLRLRIPLWSEPKRSTRPMQERRMTEPTVRDVDVVAQSATTQITPTVTQAATTTANGTSFTVINSNTTTGANLGTAIQAGGSTVILAGTFTVSSGTTVATGFNQTVGSAGIVVRTASGQTATISTQATIIGSNPTGTGTVEVRSGTTLQGVTVTSTATGGNVARAVVVDDNALTATLINNTITASASGGGSNAIAVTIGLNTTITATGNTFTATGTTGVVSAFEINLGQTLTAANNTFSASGGTTNRLMDLGSNTITGSTGNMVGSGNTGTCVHTGTITGQVSFTNGTTCP